MSLTMKICEICSKHFTVKYKHNPNRFCSTRCRGKGIRIGVSAWNKGRKGRHTNHSTSGLIHAYFKGKHIPQIAGNKNGNWKGGVTSINQQIRHSLEYKLWRRSVFERDNYTCRICGDDRGGNLEADHIKPFAYFSELRFAVDNGRTLCIDCHKTTDTWGSKVFAWQARQQELEIVRAT